MTNFAGNAIIFYMKRYSEIKERQNDETALTLLRASERCLRNERTIKYLMIFMSFSVCLAAIFNRYLPQIIPSAEDIIALQANIATYINLISGVVLVLGIVLGFYVSRMHTEGTVLQDRFEAYVFDNAPNLSVLRPIPQTIVEIYARKTRGKHDEKFFNSIYGEDENPSLHCAQYEYIRSEVRSDYKLYIYVQPFFLTIWVGFCILVMIIAVSFNDSFITTLINILIPSLSAISIIANSWHSCRLQMKQLQNLQNIIDEIQSLSEAKRTAYVTDKHNMRLLADGLFAYRASAFVIPDFLKKRFLKSDKNVEGRLEKHISDIHAADITAVTDDRKPADTKASADARKPADNKPAPPHKPAAAEKNAAHVKPVADDKPSAPPKTVKTDKADKAIRQHVGSNTEKIKLKEN